MPVEGTPGAGSPRPLRPLQWVSPEELRHFARKRSKVYMAWDDLRQTVGKGKRGFTLWAFTYGWLAHARYNQEFLETVLARVSQVQAVEVEKLRQKYEKEAGIKLLKGE